MVRDLDHLPFKERLRKLVMFNLENRRQRSNIITSCNYLEEICKNDGPKLSFGSQLKKDAMA